MNVQLLIDEIVRQTTVLIAQLSTATGLRAPLSHLADQVFRELARELDQQGIRRKVAADMFGLALRSYQMKLRRLEEENDRGASLWQSLYGDLGSGSATRDELERRHRPHSPKQVAAVLQDMVQSGIAYKSGRGDRTVFGLTSEHDRKRLDDSEGRRVHRDLCWYFVASGAAGSRRDLAQQLQLATHEIDPLIDELLHDGHLIQDGSRLSARRFERGIDAEQGWETSVMDHFRAVTTAIAAKVNHPVASKGDEVGGGTRSFLVHSQHPLAPEVYHLLTDTRERISELWRRVADYNQAVPPPTDCDRVTFYFGQHVVRGAVEETESEGPLETSHDTTAPAGRSLDTP